LAILQFFFNKITLSKYFFNPISLIIGKICYIRIVINIQLCQLYGSKFKRKGEKTIEFWKNILFRKSTARRKKSRGEFVFYEGPPTANAKPGIHHVETRVFKDAVCRYKTMRGYRVIRRAGWDTHGLPVELQIEKN